MPGGARGAANGAFASQMAAAEAGLGALLLPTAYLPFRTLVPVKTTKTLAASVEALPTSESWLVGHRVMRDVPRVSAVWGFLVEELRGVMTSTSAKKKSGRISARAAHPFG